uniref:ABC transporter permease n=1 Tax=Acidobacterium capsulatum TaxID=33075 RepID=A0A7V4XUD0_9BACT
MTLPTLALSPELQKGLLQCAVAALAALTVMFLARKQAPGLLREIPWAELRGLLQIVIVGLILAVLLHGPRWTSLLVLGAMLLAAASIVRQRASKFPRPFTLALTGIAAGAGVILCLMALTGVIPVQIAILIPVGSMVIANTMNTQALFLDRLHGEITAHTGEIEAALALGASAEAAFAAFRAAAFRASLIPALNNIRSLGIVWIPGIMAGMVLSGASPLYAALYQFVVISTIFSASALTCLVTSRLVLRRVFSPQDQLTLRA